MRAVTDRLVQLLDGPVLRYQARVESWYGGELIEERLPIMSGRIVFTEGLIERVNVTVDVAAIPPRPDEYLHPCAAYGQRLRPVLEILGPDDVVEEVPLGWFRIEPGAEWSRAGAQLQARDLSVVIERARLVSPLMLTAGGSDPNAATSAGALLYSLLAGVVPVWVEDAGGWGDLATQFYVMRDRLKGVEEILTAAAGVARFGPDGALHVRESTDPGSSPVLTLTDGKAGTLATLRPTANASAGFNACIAQGATSAGVPVWGGAFLEDGPMAWPIRAGEAWTPYGANPGFFSSPLLSSVAACKSAAESTLRRWMLGAGGTFTAEAAPDPRIETADVIELVKDGVTHLGYVQIVDLPLTASSGPMQLTGVLL